MPQVVHLLGAVTAVGRIRRDVAGAAEREFGLLLFAVPLGLGGLLLPSELRFLRLRPGSLREHRGQKGPGDTHDRGDQRDGRASHSIPPPS
ncbi:hypothetical protein ACIRJM_13820 [Streptomyces sp. NPDC102405]|uniref:hypothetical protein n=1 Tax=Streptomyces sp. NPDC102405 TaxID=3366170 RepID=UPI0037F59EB7